jgi:hypothetical protein
MDPNLKNPDAPTPGLQRHAQAAAPGQRSDPAPARAVPTETMDNASKAM